MPCNGPEYPQPRLTAEEAAAILKVTSDALQAAVQAGTLRSHHDGQGDVGFMLQDIRSYSESLASLRPFQPRRRPASKFDESPAHTHRG